MNTSAGSADSSFARSTPEPSDSDSASLPSRLKVFLACAGRDRLIAINEETTGQQLCDFLNQFRKTEGLAPVGLKLFTQNDNPIDIYDRIHHLHLQSGDRINVSEAGHLANQCLDFLSEALDFRIPVKVDGFYGGSIDLCHDDSWTNIITVIKKKFRFHVVYKVCNASDFSMVCSTKHLDDLKQEHFPCFDLIPGVGGGTNLDGFKSSDLDALKAILKAKGVPNKLLMERLEEGVTTIGKEPMLKFFRDNPVDSSDFWSKLIKFSTDSSVTAYITWVKKDKRIVVQPRGKSGVDFCCQK